MLKVEFITLGHSDTWEPFQVVRLEEVVNKASGHTGV